MHCFVYKEKESERYLFHIDMPQGRPDEYDCITCVSVEQTAEALKKYRDAYISFTPRHDAAKVDTKVIRYAALDTNEQSQCLELLAAA